MHFQSRVVGLLSPAYKWKKWDSGRQSIGRGRMHTWTFPWLSGRWSYHLYLRFGNWGPERLKNMPGLLNYEALEPVCYSEAYELAPGSLSSLQILEKILQGLLPSSSPGKSPQARLPPLISYVPFEAALGSNSQACGQHRLFWHQEDGVSDSLKWADPHVHTPKEDTISSWNWQLWGKKYQCLLSGKRGDIGWERNVIFRLPKRA